MRKNILKLQQLQFTSTRAYVINYRKKQRTLPIYETFINKS